MAAIVTNNDFVNACNWLIGDGQLTVVGARFIDANNRKVWDEQGASLVDITPDTATLEAALDNQNVVIANKQQQETDTALTQIEVKAYLRTQLINPAPNLAAIKTTIQGAISGNANVEQAITNIGTLYGYDTATDAGYVRCALLVISILT